ncbi:MAG: hypothetical protein AAB225_19485 [Acidobacteriota bacterium]
MRGPGAVLALSLALPGAAQQAGSAGPKPAPLVRGVEVRSDVTLGGIWVDVHGSRSRFLTDRYLRSGFNLGGLSLDLRPPAEASSWFNFATLSALGFGGSSPYQRADFRIVKRKLYDLDVAFRRFNYFFEWPGFALGLHPENSVGRWSSASLKLFPERTAQLHFGYRRNQQYGTAFSTEALILDTYQVSQPRRLASDEFSVGTTLKLSPLLFTLEQSFVRFRDDTQVLPNSLNPAGLIGSRLSGGQRDTPTRILTPLTRAVARYARGSAYDVTARYLYSNADLKLNRFDNLLNRVGTGGLPVRQIISSSGVSDKPTHVADLTQTIELTDKLTLHHQFHVNTYTLTGFLDTSGVLRFLSGGESRGLDLPFDERGGTATEYKLARNEVGLDYSLSKSLSVLGVWRYSDRHLGFAQDPAPSPKPLVTITHSGAAGVAWIPGAKARFRAEIEKGTSSTAFNRIEPLSFLRVKLRGELRPVAKVTLSSGAVFADNRNDTRGVNYDLDDRQVSVQAAYAASERLVFSGGYNFYRVRSSADIVFFTFARLTGGRSLYETDTHVTHAEAQLPVGPRLNLRLGYQFLKDVGASFPLRLHAPRAGLSLLLGKGISAEAGWQHYSYNEAGQAFLPVTSGYRGHELTSGLRFSF